VSITLPTGADEWLGREDRPASVVIICRAPSTQETS